MKLGDAGVPGGGSDYLYTGIADPTLSDTSTPDVEFPTVQITGHAKSPWLFLAAVLAGAYVLKGLR